MQRRRRLFAACVLAIWAPLLIGIIPLPEVLSTEFATQGEKMIGQLETQGATENAAQMHRERNAYEWQAAVEHQAWTGWIQNLVIAIGGIWGAYRTLLDRPYWRTWVVSLSIIALTVNLPGIASLYSTYDHLDQVLEFWVKAANQISNSRQWGGAYYLFIWPVVHFAVVVATAANYLSENRDQKIAA